MGKVPFRNDGDKPVHVGSVLVMPGEMKDVDEVDIHPALPVGIDEPEMVLVDLLDGKAPDVISALSSLDEGENSLFSDEDLADLLEAEEKGKKRVTVLEAIQAEILERAAGSDA